MLHFYIAQHNTGLLRRFQWAGTAYDADGSDNKDDPPAGVIRETELPNPVAKSGVQQLFVVESFQVHPHGLDFFLPFYRICSVCCLHVWSQFLQMAVVLSDDSVKVHQLPTLTLIANFEAWLTLFYLVFQP